MSTLRAILVFIAVVFLSCAVNTFAESERFDTNTRSFGGSSSTTDQTAVYATFIASIPASTGTAGDGASSPQISTAVSVTNPLAWNVNSQYLSLDGYVTEGTVEVYLWNQDGTLTVYETSDDSIGAGLNPDGTLSPGATWTFLLDAVLEAAGADANFVGYAWVVANFDGVAGSSTVTIFNVGFNQFALMVPAIGTGVHESAGLPVDVVDP